MKRLFTLLFVMAAVVGSGMALERAKKFVKPGAQQCRVAARAERQWPTGAYKSLGIGRFTDDMLTAMYGYEPVTFDVEIEQSVENPKFYRITGVYGANFAAAMKQTNGVTLTADKYDVDGVRVMDIDATDSTSVYFAKTMTGCNWGHGEMYIGIPTSANVWYKDGVFGAPYRGVACGDDEGAVAYNTRQRFNITLPGYVQKDFALTLALDSLCITGRTVTGSLKVGLDVPRVRYKIFTDFQEDDMANAVKVTAAKGANFDVRGKFMYDMGADSYKETLVVVALDADGNVLSNAWATYYHVDGTSDDWMDCGEAKFTDGLLQNFYNIEPQTMACRLERSKENPRRLRLVNPYGKHTHFEQGVKSHGTGHRHYIYINAEDDQNIYIEESPVCMDFGQGMIRVSSQIYYFLQAGFEMAEILEMAAGQTIEDGTISFAKEDLLISMMKYDNADWYYDSKPATTIQLPEGFSLNNAGVNSIQTADNAPAEYYTLQGIRIDRPTAPGLYIRRQGSTAKVIKQ